MDLRENGGRTVGGCFPRRRGDGPNMTSGEMFAPAFPPQARGWTEHAAGAALPDQVSPAGAGMDRPCRRDSGGRGGFPRRRGDGPSVAEPNRPPKAFPPQARGWTGLEATAGRRGGVSPAGAGMDRLPTSAAAPASSFPRRRGDGPSRRWQGTPVPWFPPQARGWTLAAVVGVAPGRVSPAGAGMDPPRPTSSAVNFSFPRRRGDGPR